MSKNRSYQLSITEELVANPNYQEEFKDFALGRIEVVPLDGNGYSQWEYRFCLPKRLEQKFRDLFEGIELTIDELSKIKLSIYPIKDDEREDFDICD